MGRKRIHMQKIKQILELYFEKRLTQRQIALLAKVSRPTVNEYIEKVNSLHLDWEKIKAKSENEIIDLIAPQKETTTRKKRLFDHFETASHELPKKGMTRMLLWEEYSEVDPSPYGYSQYCYHFELWRKEKKQLCCIIEHKPGAEMYLDYSGLKMPYYPETDSNPLYAEIFVAILGYSQKTFAMALATQNQLDTLDACNKAVLYFRGTALSFVPDNMKTAVKKADAYEPIMNRSFEEFASHYGAVVVPARPGKSRDKALVENAVRHVQRRIIRRFRNSRCKTVEELNGAIAVLLEALNNRHFQKMKKSRNDLWETVERPVLKPLPSILYVPRVVSPAKVSPQCHVELKEDNHTYSVPHRYAGKHIQLLYTAFSVEMRYENERIAFHKRDRERGGITSREEHLHRAQLWYRSLTASNAIRWAREDGPYVERLAEEIIRRTVSELQGCRSVMGVLKLKKKFSQARIDVACRLAIREQNYSYQRVKAIIEKGLDLVFIESENMQAELPLHDNIRGADAYA
jgi:transposase